MEAPLTVNFDGEVVEGGAVEEEELLEDV